MQASCERGDIDMGASILERRKDANCKMTCLQQNLRDWKAPSSMSYREATALYWST